MNGAKVVAVFVPLRQDVLIRMSKQKLGRGYSLEDVVQEAYMRLIRLGSDDETIDNPLGYLLRIARNVMSGWNSRKGGSHVDIHDAAEELCDTDARQPENIWESDELAASVRALIGGLPRRQQQALTLRLDHELTYEQIADTLGITYRMVLRDLTNAYRTLRARVRSRQQLQYLQIPERSAQTGRPTPMREASRSMAGTKLRPAARGHSKNQRLAPLEAALGCAQFAPKEPRWLGPRGQGSAPEIHPY